MIIPIEISKYLCEDHTMLEWGSGQSTVDFPKFVRRYYSIEHHWAWYQKCLESVRDIDNVRLFFSPAEVSQEMLDDWQNIDQQPCFDANKFKELKLEYPDLTDYSIKRFFQLSSYVDFPSYLGIKFDRILIDGRSRSMCAAKSLRLLSVDGIVFFDDYFGREDWHSDILAYYRIVERVDRLAVLSIK